MMLKSEFLQPFNPLPSHEGRLSIHFQRKHAHLLSIHFPLTREDHCSIILTTFLLSFNPLPSHEGRHPAVLAAADGWAFQSTSLSRGKTLFASQGGNTMDLSIHFPLTREDVCGFDIYSYYMSFQSTSLSRGKTTDFCSIGRRCGLSIHFPLTREDLPVFYSHKPSNAFNPLPSHEGRPMRFCRFLIASVFQSTSLSRGKTVIRADDTEIAVFQSTSLSRGKTETLVLLRHSK